MLIPHLHFNGDCNAAIALYEKAFNTKVDYDSEICADGTIAHASMKIHGQQIMLNDRAEFSNKEKSLGGAHIIVQFGNANELLVCYEHFKDECTIIDPFEETFYSDLVGNFIDKFGIMWGFMVA